MAGCVIAAGVTTPACTDRFSSPGINREDIWVFNKSEITSFTSVVVGEVSAIVLEMSEVAFLVAVHKNSAQFVEGLQTSEESAPFYTQSFAARIIANDTTTRNSIEGFVDVDVVIVFKQKNGKFRIIGETGGVKLTANEYDSGRTEGDAVGDTLEWTGVENGKARFFFNTDEATTKTTLDAYLT